MFIIFLFINYVCSAPSPDKSCIVDLGDTYQADLRPLMKEDGAYEVRDEHSDSSFFRLAYGTEDNHSSVQHLWPSPKKMLKR
jgi:hypothetical protein